MRRLALALAFASLAAPAGAEPAAGFRGCGTHAEISVWLAQQFGEAPLARGRQGDGHLLEIYAGKAGQSWTVVVTDPAGESCIVSEGTGLELLPAPPDDPPVA
jgi:hypothetical protein